MDECNSYSTEMIDSELAGISFITTSIMENQSFICDNFQTEHILFEPLQTEIIDVPNIALVRIR